MNKVFLIGRWVKDIEFKTLNDGNCVSMATIAVDDGYGDKKKTYFIDVESWGKTAEAVANYTKKGYKVAVEGKMVVDQWEKDDKKHYKTKVVAENIEFLESKKGNENES